jgi:hypothetical protein
MLVLCEIIGLCGQTQSARCLGLNQLNSHGIVKMEDCRMSLRLYDLALEIDQNDEHALYDKALVFIQLKDSKRSGCSPSHPDDKNTALEEKQNLRKEM